MPAVDDSLLRNLFWQFRRRFDWIAAPEAKVTVTNKKARGKKSKITTDSKRPTQLPINRADKTDLSRILMSSQTIARKQVYQVWKLYPQDAYGDIVQWLGKLFEVRP